MFTSTLPDRTQNRLSTVGVAPEGSVEAIETSGCQVPLNGSDAPETVNEFGRSVSPVANVAKTSNTVDRIMPPVKAHRADVRRQSTKLLGRRTATRRPTWSRG